jgi:flagellar basal body-associated protein FliL
MPVKGPDHAFHIRDASDSLEAARPWAPRGKRRVLVIAVLAVFLLLAASFALTVHGLLSQGVDSPVLAGASVATLALAGLGFWVDRMLFKATRPAFALPGEIYDERQIRLNDEARRGARWISFVVIALLTLLGALGVSAGVVLAAGLAGAGLVMSGQQLVLAWTLEAEEFAFDGDA